MYKMILFVLVICLVFVFIGWFMFQEKEEEGEIEKKITRLKKKNRKHRHRHHHCRLVVTTDTSSPAPSPPPPPPAFTKMLISNFNGNSLEVFNITDDGDTAPQQIIQGDQTMLVLPTEAVADNVNAEFVVASFVKFTSNGSITVYPNTANGNVAPIRVISGSNTLLKLPESFTVDIVNG